MADKETYPIPVHSFKVKIGKDSVGFSEVSGLAIERETVTYNESGTDKPTTVNVHMLGQAKPVNITLKKGFASSKSKDILVEWMGKEKGYTPEKRDVVIEMCDQEGKTVFTWKVMKAFPTKLEIPTFDAKSNDVAIGTLSLMADSVIAAK